MTRRGLERIRFTIFNSMRRSGATVEEALAYLNLIHPFEEVA